MIDYELEYIDPDDIRDILVKVEKSFNIKFGNNELEHIVTFGELCDHIVDKIKLDLSGDCTTQQAFYKLRNAISSQLKIDAKTISTDFQLIDFLPRQNRRAIITEIEKHLGFKLNILRPPHCLTIAFLILLLASFVKLFFNWQIGLLWFAISIGGLWVSNKTGNELDVRTIGQVAEKMTRENYLKSRRNSKTFNKREIERVLVDLFSNDLGLDKSKLKREAKFYNIERE